MSTESMSERMTGDASWPTKAFLVFMDVSGQKEGVDWPALICLLWEKPYRGLTAFKPVFSQDVQSVFG